MVNSSGTKNSLLRRFRRTELGQTMVEFALMLPFMLLLGIGIVEIGRAIFYTIEVNNAATAAVEYGSQDITTASNAAGMQSAAVCDANGSTNGVCNTNGVLTTSNVTATWGCTCDDGGGTTNEACTYPVPAQSTCNSLQNTCAG